jgi:hypothetical protein
MKIKSLSQEGAYYGIYIKLDGALKAIVGYGMPSLVVCASNKLTYFEAEQIKGAPPRYILEMR